MADLRRVGRRVRLKDQDLNVYNPAITQTVGAA
jgi:hypothetical protein